MIYLRDKYHISSGLAIGDRNIDVEAGKAAGLDCPTLFDNVATLRRAIDIVEKRKKNDRRNQKPTGTGL